MKKNVLKVLGVCFILAILAYAQLAMISNSDDPRFLYNTPTTSITMNA